MQKKHLLKLIIDCIDCFGCQKWLRITCLLSRLCFFAIILCFPLCLTAQDSPKDNSLIRFAGRTLTLPSAGWEVVINYLSRTLDIPIVSFVPEKWQHQPLSGDALTVLNSLASQVGGRWSLWDGRICLWEDWIPDYLQNPQKLQILMREVSYEPDILWKKFLFSLSDTQIALFQAGRKLAVKELSVEQINLLKQIAKEDILFAQALASYMERGEIACYVRAGVVVYWRGRWLTPEQLSTVGKWPFLPPGRLLAPQWEEIKRQTDSIVKEGSQVSIKELQIFSLGQLPKLVKLPRNREFVVSSLISGKKVVVSAGRWDQSVLLTLIQVATQTELRQIGEVVHLAPSQLARLILGNKAALVRAEVEWQHLSRIIGKLCKSPLSNVSPVPVEILLNPILIPYPRLTSAEKEWVNQEGFPAPPPANLRESEEVECYFFPSIVFDFSTADRREHKSRSFSPLVNYSWLALRTAARLASDK